MVIFAFSDSVALSMSCLFAMGLISIPWITAMMIMFQNAATYEMRGRVMSLYVIGMNTFPLGWLFGGAVAEALGNEEALVISALLGTPVAAIAIASSRSLRHA
jgi:predicted MFS family arabinose efflux permease